jgi:magnesium transporter
MVPRVVAIPQTATVMLACEMFALHRLLALPVVDDDKRMVGVVDMELYTDELGQLDTHERSDEIFQLLGVDVERTETGSPWRSFRARFPWLLCNIGGGLLAAVLAVIYEDVSNLPWVVPFIPVVLALSESVSIQSVTLALRLLHTRRPSWALLASRGGSEAMTGLLLGLACGGLVGLVALLWMQKGFVMLCLLGGIAAGVTVAAAFGFALPVLFRLLQRDPQVAAGPVALAVADMITLLVYFNLARLLLAGGRG